MRYEGRVSISHTSIISETLTTNKIVIYWLGLMVVLFQSKVPQLLATPQTISHFRLFLSLKPCSGNVQIISLFFWSFIPGPICLASPVIFQNYVTFVANNWKYDLARSCFVIGNLEVAAINKNTLLSTEIPLWRSLRACERQRLYR